MKRDKQLYINMLWVFLGRDKLWHTIRLTSLEGEKNEHTIDTSNQMHDPVVVFSSLK